MAGGSAPARNYRGLLRVHLPFGLRTCTLVAPRTSPEAPVDDLSPQLLQWLPGEPTIPRTGLAPAGLRDPGGLAVNLYFLAHGRPPFVPHCHPNRCAAPDWWRPPRERWPGEE